MHDTTRQLLEVIPRLRRYARALTGDADLADELVQDCLERAWGRLALWRPGSDMRAWSFTILHNLYVNRARQAAVRPKVVTLDGVDRGGPSVSPVQDTRLEVLSVVEALNRLPDEQRQLLLLVGLEGLSYRQAADALDIPIGTVMSRLSRGREQLRLTMAGETSNVERLK